MSQTTKIIQDIGMDVWRKIYQLRQSPEAQKRGLPPPGAPLTDAEIFAVYHVHEIDAGVPKEKAEEDAEKQIMILGATKWVSCGLQQVEMGHKFCAAMLVSDVTQEVINEVRHPWPAFMIIVPDNLIFMWDDRKNKLVSIQKVLVLEVDNKHGRWAYMAWDKDMDLSIWRFGINTLRLLPPVEEGAKEEMTWGTVEMTDTDVRAASMVGRLIVTTCLALTMPEMNKTPIDKRTHDAWLKVNGNPLRVKPEMPVSAFRIGKPITLDFRERVSEYSKTGRRGSRLEVRAMVQGHFKMQHYGKGNLQMKRIYREAYYRGPEDATMLVRPHVIIGDDS